MGSLGKKEMAGLLSSVPLFSTCSKKELSLLAGIAEVQDFEPGRPIFEAGDTEIGLHVIVEGETEVIIGSETRRKLGPGTFFGEISLLDGQPRSATVRAATAVKTLYVPAWTFNATLKSQPEMALKMLKELARRFRETGAS